MFIIFFLTILILIMGILENYFHNKRVKSIPVRIHVNGTRGKSTTVRLVASILRESGYKVLAKTTGTSPKIILENGEEELIKRRGPSNIIEQKRFIKKAFQRKCNAIVAECMAVHPETQWVSEHRLIYSTIGIITNVREDHQDVCGPDLRDAANALKSTIPGNSILVTAEQNFVTLFKKQAESLNTNLILVEPEKIIFPEKTNLVNFFFKDNIAIALQVGKLLNIDEGICWQGIFKARSDPGALTIYKLERETKSLWFINAFAANDRESILLIRDKINHLLPKEAINSTNIAILNNRGDRITRITQFAQILSKEIIVDHIFLIGQNNLLSFNLLKKSGFPSERITMLNEKDGLEHNIELVFQFTKKVGLVYGLGNTRGFGLNLMDYLREEGVKL